MNYKLITIAFGVALHATTAQAGNCTQPTTAGYVYTGESGSKTFGNFTVGGITCADGYAGTATVTECPTDGSNYVVADCVQCGGAEWAVAGQGTTCAAHTSCGNQVNASTTRLNGATATAAGTCDACASGSWAATGADDCAAVTTPTCGKDKNGTNNRTTVAATTTADAKCADCASGYSAATGAGDCVATTTPTTTAAPEPESPAALPTSSAPTQVLSVITIVATVAAALAGL